MPMPLLTADERTRLNRESTLFRKIDLGTRLGDAGTLRHSGRWATSHVRVGTNPNDADTLTIVAGPATVDGVFHAGKTVVYEIDTGNAVTAGNARVVRGANAGATATALAAAILANQGVYVKAAVHGTDTTVVDVAQRTQGAALTLSTSSGGRLLVQNNAEQLVKDAYVLWAQRRTVTAEDATRTRVRIDTGLTSIVAWSLRITTSVSLNTELAWDGTATVTGGVLELTVGSSAPLAAGNILALFVLGQR